MTSTTQKAGKVARNTAAKEMQQDEVKLLKTQDAGYIRMQAQQERRKIEGLENRLGAGFAGEGEHTVFVEDEGEAKGFDPASWFNTPEELLERRQNRVTNEMLKDGRLKNVVDAVETETGVIKSDRPMTEEEKRIRRKEEAEMKKRQRMREREYRELKARMERERDLKRVEMELEEQRAKMGKGASQGAKNKWAKERKR